MIRSIAIVVVLLAGILGVVYFGSKKPPPPPPQYRLAIALPHATDLGTAERVLQSVGTLVGDAAPGTPVLVLDGMTQDRISEFTVPVGRTPAAKLRPLARPLAAIRRHLSESTQRGISPSGRVHLPRVLDTVGSQPGPEGNGTRLVVYGSGFFGTGTDGRFDFWPGVVPSMGHILASRSESVFGTDDLPPVGDVVVVWVNLEPTADDPAIQAIRRFWTAYVAERGGVLTGWTEDPAAAAGLALSERSESILQVAIDRADLRREILRVAPATLPPTLGLCVPIDASASMDAAFAQLDSGVPDLAARLYDAGAEIRLYVVPFREAPLPVYGPARVRTSAADGGASVSAAQAFLRGTPRQNAYVDPRRALRRGMELLDQEQPPSQRQCLLYISDCGVEEIASPNNPDSVGELERQILGEVQAWLEARPGRSVHALYVGQAGDNRQRFFEALAALSGHRSANAMHDITDRLVAQAAGIARAND